MMRVILNDLMFIDGPITNYSIWPKPLMSPMYYAHERKHYQHGTSFTPDQVNGATQKLD